MNFKKRYNISKKVWEEIARNTKYCRHCGHSILFSKKTKKIICNYCGHWVYNNIKDEFKERLLQKKKRLENEI